MQVNIVLSLSEEMFDKLRRAAQAHNLESLEALVMRWAEEDELARRREAVAKVEAIRKELSEKYGMMPDSVDLIREDRER